MHPKKLGPLIISATTIQTSNFVPNFGLAVGCQNKFRTNFGKGWAWEHPKIFWTLPTYFCNRWIWRLHVWYATLACGDAYQKQLLGPKLAGIWGREHPKFGTPYLFLQPLKLATSNLAHNMSSGLPCRCRKQLLGTRQAGSELGECPQKLVTVLLHTLKLIISNLVHNLDLGISLSKQLLRHKLAMFWEEPPKFWNRYDVFWHLLCTNVLIFVTGAHSKFIMMMMTVTVVVVIQRYATILCI